MQIEESIGIFKILSDKSRLLIVKSLLEKPQYLEELAERLDLAVSTVSFHLKKLENAKIVHKDRQQYYTIFFVKTDIFEKKLKEFLQFELDQEAEQIERIKRYKNQVLRSFIKNGKIVQIPSQKQKRWIVFEQILKNFDFDKTYSESDVNEIIKTYHEDYCLIRRTFIEERVMKRENDIYSLTKNYENFCKGNSSFSIKNGMIEGYLQSVRDKFGVK